MLTFPRFLQDYARAPRSVTEADWTAQLNELDPTEARYWNAHPLAQSKRPNEDMAAFVQRTVTEQAGQHALWAEAGLPLTVPWELSRLTGLPADHAHLQQTPQGPRCVIQAERLKALVPDRGPFETVEGAIKRHLAQYGVHNPEIKSSIRSAFARFWDVNDERQLSLRPQDLSLLIDTLHVGRRAAGLCRRIPGSGILRVDNANVFRAPASVFLAMRGVRQSAGTNPTTLGLLDAIAQRISERGGDPYCLRTTPKDGVDWIELPSHEARILLAPIMPTDAACEMREEILAFDGNVAGYCRDNALVAVNLSDLVYEDAAKIDHYMKVWGFEQHELIHDSLTDGTALVAQHQNGSHIVAFCGTNSWRDIWTDMQMNFVKSATFGTLPMPEGPLEQFEALLPKIQAAIGDKKTAMVCGHSLGGVLAAMYIVWAKQQGFTVPHAMTFGGPYWAHREHSPTINSLIKDSNFFRFVNHNDIIARLPGADHHAQIGACIYFDESGIAHALTDAEAEALEVSLRGQGADDHRLRNYRGLLVKAEDQDPIVGLGEASLVDRVVGVFGGVKQFLAENLAEPDAKPTDAAPSSPAKPAAP